jgi:hypothetical protein
MSPLLRIITFDSFHYYIIITHYYIITQIGIEALKKES